jgi:uncharacterized membrane protein
MASVLQLLVVSVMLVTLQARSAPVDRKDTISLSEIMALLNGLEKMQGMLTLSLYQVNNIATLQRWNCNLRWVYMYDMHSFD